MPQLEARHREGHCASGRPSTRRQGPPRGLYCPALALDRGTFHTAPSSSAWCGPRLWATPQTLPASWPLTPILEPNRWSPSEASCVLSMCCDNDSGDNTPGPQADYHLGDEGPSKRPVSLRGRPCVPGADTVPYGAAWVTLADARRPAAPRSPQGGWLGCPARCAGEDHGVSFLLAEALAFVKHRRLKGRRRPGGCPSAPGTNACSAAAPRLAWPGLAAVCRH